MFNKINKFVTYTPSLIKILRFLDNVPSVKEKSTGQVLERLLRCESGLILAVNKENETEIDNDQFNVLLDLLESRLQATLLSLIKMHTGNKASKKKR